VGEPEIKVVSEGEGDAEKQTLSFSAVNKAGQPFAVSLPLRGLVAEGEKGIKIHTTARHVTLALEHRDAERRWGGLVSGKAPQFVKVDWSKWVDSDDEDGMGAGGGFDMSQFGDMGGMGGGGMGGGMGGMDLQSLMASMGQGGAGGAGGMGDMDWGEGEGDSDDGEEADEPGGATDGDKAADEAADGDKAADGDQAADGDKAE